MFNITDKESFRNGYKFLSMQDEASERMQARILGRK